MPNALRRAALLLAFASGVLTACNFTPDPPTPTVEGFESPTPMRETQVLTPTPSLTASNAPTVAAIRLASATPSGTPLPATETSTPTPTDGPYVVRVRAGDTLFGIIGQFGYTDGRVIPAILTLNPNVPNENSLPVGQDIFIPRMTHTPTPPNYEATVSIMETRGIPLPDRLPSDTEISAHTVTEGQSIIDIAEQYNTTIEIISRLNPELVFSNCDFNNRSGGPDCSVIIRPGQNVRIPLPSATPTLSPTPSGNETPTPTPTYNPPITIYPPNGAIITGSVLLQWVSVGLLKADEQYYVEVTDRTANTLYTRVTKDTSLQLPMGLVPSDGTEHSIEWRVVVVRGDGENFTVIGGVMPSRTFKWRRQ
ncbi:MAG: LysM peptidoglycan-binding domain-containing protein [Chloroflexi bacterium]|nr:LysM peptidoglycan-binding domain-containing protein [Chloroflexota bacterium]